jgi:predicted N-acetyltransferase YhbS
MMKNILPLVFESLKASHDRASFSCGQKQLDNYFRTLVSQDVKRRICLCDVAASDGQIAGFYTLSPAQVDLSALPEKLKKKLPRVPLPCYRLGRLAVDIEFQGKGIGADLLLDALLLAANSEIPAYAMIVDAKDESAAEFYRRFGFISLQEKAETLMIPLKNFRGKI